MTQTMVFTRFNNFVLKNYFLRNDMITKIASHEIEHQPNIMIFVWDY
jgi:hypothetical protein